MGAANNSSSSNTGQGLNGLPVPGGNGFAVSRDLNPKLTDVSSLKPLGRETRKHPAAQLRKLQSSLEQFGIVLPVIVDAERRVVAGWGLVLAARKMGLLQIPAVTIDDLDESKLRLLRLALNRLGEEASWDFDALALEFAAFSRWALTSWRTTAGSARTSPTTRCCRSSGPRRGSAACGRRATRRTWSAGS